MAGRVAITSGLGGWLLLLAWGDILILNAICKYNKKYVILSSLLILMFAVSYVVCIVWREDSFMVDIAAYIVLV